MKAENAGGFVKVWTEELNRTAMLWNSLPKNKMEGFREFLTEYKEFIGYATFHVYGSKAVIELLNGGLDPEVIGLTLRTDSDDEVFEKWFVENFAAREDKNPTKPDKSLRRMFGDPNKKSDVVQ